VTAYSIHPLRRLRQRHPLPEHTRKPNPTPEMPGFRPVTRSPISRSDAITSVNPSDPCPMFSRRQSNGVRSMIGRPFGVAGRSPALAPQS
jgi:hypothetical protein